MSLNGKFVLGKVSVVIETNCFEPDCRSTSDKAAKTKRQSEYRQKTKSYISLTYCLNNGITNFVSSDYSTVSLIFFNSECVAGKDSLAD